MEAALQLGEAEYVQLMADMEQSFLDDMLQDEAAFLSQLDAQDLDSLVSLSHPHEFIVSSALHKERLLSSGRFSVLRTRTGFLKLLEPHLTPGGSIPDRDSSELEDLHLTPRGSIPDRESQA